MGNGVSRYPQSERANYRFLNIGIYRLRVRYRLCVKAVPFMREISCQSGTVYAWISLLDNRLIRVVTGLIFYCLNKGSYHFNLRIIVKKFLRFSL